MMSGNARQKEEVDAKADFSEGFKPESIAKAAEADILPSLKLSELVDEERTLTIRFDGEPRKVINPKLPKGEGWFIDVVYSDQRMSMVIPGSLRFSLLTMAKRNNWEGFNGQTVVISSTVGTIKTGSFQGEAKTYTASLPA